MTCVHGWTDAAARNVSGSGEARLTLEIRPAEVPQYAMCSRRPTVLIVDDDPSVIQTFGRMLGLTGYDVVTALDAEAGLQAIATNHPDAVLLDLRMPFSAGTPR